MDGRSTNYSHGSPVHDIPGADTSAAEPIVPKDSPLASASAAAGEEPRQKALPTLQDPTSAAASSRGHPPQQQMQLDASLTADQQGSARAFLGDVPSRSQLDDMFRKERLEGEREFKRKWNFDAEKDQPVQGQWKWKPMG